MYEELFHSPDRPFRATPDTKFYFPYESIETARQTVVRAVMRAEGPVMVLGGAGLGKSLLGMIVADDLAARFDVVKLHAARLCSRRALLQSILFELQLPYRDLSEGELRLSMLDRLEPSSNHAPDGVLLIVDEAHTLPVKLLDELRLISNFTRANQPRARVILIGNLRLEHTFAEPQMESFNQRLAARCYLQPLTRQQTRDYIHFQLTTAGIQPRQMVTEDAIQTIYAASEGVPRLTNQIMDHALVLAITRGQSPVSGSLIEEAWADLQQLPAPWHMGADKVIGGNESSSTTGPSIEFGALRDEDDLTSEPSDRDKPGVAHQVNYTITDDFPSDSDLLLADMGPQEFDAPSPNNFFAAFAPPADESAEDLGELTLADELLTRPRVVFDMQQARQQAQQFELNDVGDEYHLTVEPSIDGFFVNRPTDERMLALEAEQREFDSMGVWENDPPLSDAAVQAGNPYGAGRAPESIPINLFGDDFEEEICVTVLNSSPASSTLEPQSPEVARVSNQQRSPEILATKLAESDAATTAQQAAAAGDLVARLQQFADESLDRHSGSNETALASADEVCFENPAQGYPQLAMQAALDTWSVDVASVDVQHEVAVAEEIEDLVSQLNFAAFSVEPYSIEHIDISPADRQSSVPVDSVRNGKQDEIYTLHRPQQLAEENVFNGWSSSASTDYDDDRDLLIVEEEVPLIAKSANEAERPVTKIAPYSQLFAKLRK
jgi:type II secretory pathway predicted ATPase ExeA